MGDHAHHHHHHQMEVSTPIAPTTAPSIAVDMSHHNHHDHSSMDHGSMANHMVNHMMSMAVIIIYLMNKT